MTGWQPDVLPGYWQLTIPLGDDPDGEGDIDATLLRRGDAAPAADAVLAVHGYTDYFFHTELADISPVAGSRSMRWTCASVGARRAAA